MTVQRILVNAHARSLMTLLLNSATHLRLSGDSSVHEISAPRADADDSPRSRDASCADTARARAPIMLHIVW